PGSSIYSATKFALRGFLASLQAELKTSGIHVSGIYPGAIDTPMLRYEAQEGGSALNFIAPPATPEEVTKAFFKLLKRPKLEVYVPHSGSLSARFFAGVLPAIANKMIPGLERKGEKGRQRYLKSQRSHSSAH
ncbi:MAG: SDR family oxidoreductase, partial [Pseudomonadota bacterium]